MSRSLSVLAVRAHPKHLFAFSRYSLADDTTHVPVASLCDPKYCQVPSRNPAGIEDSSAALALGCFARELVTATVCTITPG